ncbi:MAG TPA: PfkB family carbohydrate kinase, partial [Terrimicrobiaceae bacterium]
EILRDGKIDISAAKEAAHKLVAAGVREWVVIHFPNGAIAVSVKGEELLQASINMPQSLIAGTTGAGDAFAAGVLLGLHEGISMATALTYGVCSAAASLTHPACSDGVELLADCLSFAEKFGYRRI